MLISHHNKKLSASIPQQVKATCVYSITLCCIFKAKLNLMFYLLTINDVNLNLSNNNISTTISVQFYIKYFVAFSF